MEDEIKYRSKVYASRFTPDVKGSEVAFEIGEIAIAWPPLEKDAEFRGRRVVILSSHTYNHHVPEGKFCREVRFEADGEEGTRFLVYEDSLRVVNPQEFYEKGK